jgi:VanZ family protein
MKKFLICIILLAIGISWAYGIYKLSDMNTEKSNGKSTDVLALFIEDTLEVTNDYGITSSHPSDEKLAKASQLINAPMRKVAHASVYFVLAFFIIVFLNVLMNNKHYWISLILAIMICVRLCNI